MLDMSVDARFRLPEVLFFGIGAQKCGTTWLHHYLSRRDDVCMPPRKELHYWNGLKGDVDAHVRALAKSVKEQEAAGQSLDSARLQLRILRNRDTAHTSYADAIFTRYTGQKVAGEITPDYAQLEESDFARMAALNPDTRFILLMRDPIERLNSSMRKRLRWRDGGDRKTAISGEAMLTELREVLTRKNPVPIQRSRYERTIAKLENVTEASRIGLFFYEDIFGNRNVDAVCDFLSIPRRPGDFDLVANQGNPVVDERDQEFRELAMQKLAPTYEYMEARFGAALPAAWRRVKE